MSWFTVRVRTPRWTTIGGGRPAPPEPDASADEWVAAILAPARSGMVIVRGDLARASRDVGLAYRMGERAYALRALFGQDAAATLAWLSTEAVGWIGRHQAAEPALGEIARFWRSRAEASLAALRDPWAAVAAARGDVGGLD